jgi:hypothetical protein
MIVNRVGEEGIGPGSNRESQFEVTILNMNGLL